MSAMVVQDDSDRSRSPERGIRCGRGLRERWDDDLDMMSSVAPLLDSNWELLSLREKNHRLYIRLILVAKTWTWSELSMPEKLALVDPDDYDGHRMQIQTICTARLTKGRRHSSLWAYSVWRSLWIGIPRRALETHSQVDHHKAPIQGISM